MIESLIDDLSETGREITAEELLRLRRVVADAGFGPGAESRASKRTVGSVWQGRVIRSGERLPNDVRHYLLHAVELEEWPLGTTLEEYVQSLREAVLDDDGAVSLEQVGAFKRMTFLSASRSWRGPAGGDWILVGYNIGHGYWSTGYQPDREYVSAIQEERPGRRWLR